MHPNSTPLYIRFWSKVDTSGDCWTWTAYKTRSGYGTIRINGYSCRANRTVWEMIHGPIPKGLWVLHHCDNPACVKPDHLYLGTHTDNVRDRVERGRNAKRNGEASGTAVLTESDVLEIRARYAKGGVTHQQLADEYGVSRVTVTIIINRQTWSHI